MGPIFLEHVSYLLYVVTRAISLDESYLEKTKGLDKLMRAMGPIYAFDTLEKTAEADKLYTTKPRWSHVNLMTLLQLIQIEIEGKEVGFQFLQNTVTFETLADIMVEYLSGVAKNQLYKVIHEPLYLKI